MNRSQIIAYDSSIIFFSICFIVLCVILIFLCKKKPIQPQEVMPTKVYASQYSLTDIDLSTDGFNRRRIIGQGRLGTVYAAVLVEQLVAVKRIHSHLVLSNAGFGFSSIVKSLSLGQHSNIVSILGFAEGPGERIIVMEFDGMVGLDFYLHSCSDGSCVLDWFRRIRIAAGAARGLEYLHEGMVPNVVHGSVKSSNILIDEKFCARVCDYGLSFLAPKGKMGGDEFDGVCKESDVYGFGVVLLEILSGRKGEQGLLVSWAIPLIKEMKYSEFLDPRLEIPSDINPIVRLAKVALACVGNSRKIRPSIVQVVAILTNLEMEVCF